jgi:hypothetical protein
VFLAEQRTATASRILAPQREFAAGPPVAQDKESAMHGQITKYRDDLGYGIIESDCGRRYRFARHQIKNSAETLIGESVDFVLVANRPSDIIMMSGSPWTAFGGISEQE